MFESMEFNMRVVVWFPFLLLSKAVFTQCCASSVTVNIVNNSYFSVNNRSDVIVTVTEKHKSYQI